jgi:2-hydroxy-3-keto-5-methylthiopentenyl-1-phosphate phosphatase
LTISSDRVFAINFEHTEDGTFKSLAMSQDLMYHDGKKNIIDILRKEHKNKKIIFVGDSVGDMEAGKSADLFI